MRGFIPWAFILLWGGLLVIAPSLAIYWLNELPLSAPSYRSLITHKVEPGGELQVKVISENSGKCVATIHRTIVDSTGKQTIYEPIPRPLDLDYTLKVTIPANAALGAALLKARREWVCNILQQYWPHVVENSDLDFEIIPQTEGAEP